MKQPHDCATYSFNLSTISVGQSLSLSNAAQITQTYLHYYSYSMDIHTMQEYAQLAVAAKTNPGVLCTRHTRRIVQKLSLKDPKLKKKN